jgi:hypothetical protein
VSGEKRKEKTKEKREEEIEKLVRQEVRSRETRLLQDFQLRQDYVGQDSGQAGVRNLITEI